MLRRILVSATSILLVVAVAAAIYYLRQPSAPSFAALTAGCRPPPGFRVVAQPRLNELTPFVSRTETILIDRPLTVVVDMVEHAALQDAIQKSDLPHVSGTYDLSPTAFGRPGTRRMTCLSDGSFLVEQVLRNVATPDRNEFTYLVWNYTSPTAAPIDFSVGSFVRRALPSSKTETSWTYRFKLKDDRFPGDLGGIGRWAFRRAFLDRSYAAMMRSTLAAEKRRAEALPAR